MKNAKIKVLVVEDEILLIKNIKKKITAISPDFNVVGEAFNGREALDIIKQSHPDVVFTDIRMPIMDGLELARILHEEYPEILTVIVSGYDDFEYARTMLTYRVYDYILKPLQTPVLEKLLASLQECTIKKRTGEISKFLQAQMDGTAVPSFEVNAYPELETASFFLFFICFGNLRSCSQAADEEGIPSASEVMDFVSSGFQIFPYASGNLYLLLADCSELPYQDSSAENTSCEYMAGHFHASLIQAFPHCTVNLAYCGEKIGYRQLYCVKNELYKLLSTSLVIGHSALFERSAARDILPPAILSMTSVNHFQVVIAAGNAPAFQTAAKTLFLEWYEQQYPQQWIEKVLHQLLNLLQRNLYFSETESDKMFHQVFYLLETQSNLMDAADQIIPELLQWMALYQSIPSETENTIEELDSYLRSHYTEYINLSELAEKYHFNPSYLTRIFKKQKGEAPLKLINTLRIHDAKKLLTNPDLSVKEISEMIGYSNQHYFSRIFKEFTKQTPKEYRNANLNR